MSQMWTIDRSPCLQHHGIKGMKWGVWNAETRARYSGRDRVFISGKVSFDKQLPKKVKDEINQVMKANAQIIVGDAPGADTRVQDYLAKSGYSNVTVFTSEGKARNNVGNWKERNIGKKLEDERARRAQKDIAMTNLATKAIAIMPKDDRPDSAMSKNLDRLKTNGIKTTLYDINSDMLNVNSNKGLSLVSAKQSVLSKFLGSHNKEIADNISRSEVMDIKLDNKKIGDAQLFRESDKVINGVWLGINKNQRGKGYATAILKELIEYSKNIGMEKFTLEVPGDSKDARHIYEKLGFVVDKQISGEDDVWGGLTSMHLDLKK